MADKGSFWDSKFGGFLNNLLLGLPSLIYSEIKSSHLTGAEREQNAFNAMEAQKQRDYESAQAERQMQFQSQQVNQQLGFQQEMASTQYQRAVKDMQAAGVNPALAMSQGGNVAPSGVAAAGAAGSGVAASGSGRGIPSSMSEIMAGLKLRSEMRLLEAQAKNVAEDTRNKESERLKRDIESSWLPRIYASELDINQSLLDKYSAEISEILASAEGQRIMNDWRPKLFESQLENDRVNRDHTIAGIAKIQQEVKNLISENANILEDTRYKQFLQGLVIAQTVLANSEAREISARAWHEEFENSFIKEYGHKPDEPLWNAITSILSYNGSALKDALRHPFGIGKNKDK